MVNRFGGSYDVKPKEGKVMSGKAWRPPDWPKNPYTKMLPETITCEHNRELTAEERIFEAGADKMLLAVIALVKEIAPNSRLVDILATQPLNRS